MSIKIYLLKTHKVNLTNLFVGQLLKNAGNSCYGACDYFLDGKFINNTLGDFAKFQLQSTEKDLRNIDWSQNLVSLNTSVDLIKNENKILIFGNHNPTQLSFLKSYYGSAIKTIGIDYNTNSYSLLLQNLAEYHFHLLKTQSISANQHDLELMSTLPDDQLIEHYKIAFDQSSYIPHTSVTDADYTVLVEDFFNPQLMEQHFINLGLPFTDTSRSFYDSWLSVM